jgi:hypothetical protein
MTGTDLDAHVKPEADVDATELGRVKVVGRSRVAVYGQAQRALADIPGSWSERDAPSSRRSRFDIMAASSSTAMCRRFFL